MPALPYTSPSLSCSFQFLLSMAVGPFSQIVLSLRLVSAIPALHSLPHIYPVSGDLMKPQDPSPPIAPRHPHPTAIHGVTLADDYAWLRDKGSPVVTAYLEAENAYTAAAMSGIEQLQKAIYDEILSHIKEDDV